MKKYLSIILSILMLASLFALTGCGEEPDATPATLKFGSAVYVSAPTATDATADQNGQGSVDVTVAAVSVDADGKIVACALDTMQSKLAYTTEGKAIGNPEAKTKAEQGDAYNMVTYGGAKQEWYKQADAFEGVVAGKTLAEVKALVAEGNKGNDEVVNAGCTIMIQEFVGAIEKAYNAAGSSNVTAEHTLKVSAYTAQEIADATADQDGKNQVDVYTFAAAVDSSNKIVAASSDCVQVSFGFDTTGKSKFDTTKEILSKKEQGSNYGMTAIGKQEWYIQAMAFDSQCIGLTSAEIAGLMGADGKGVESVQTAGCTIYVTGFVKAASKI